jgi:excinuclease ABC subunit A
LCDLTVAFPVGRLTAVSGVSGSGKSTLVFEVLEPALEALAHGQSLAGTGCQDVLGAGELKSQVVSMGQRTSEMTLRSQVGTFTGVLDTLRDRLARTPLARERGLQPYQFSTNVAGGRCERCHGLGSERVDLVFLADVTVPCEVCGGQRFKPSTLEVRWRGANILDLHQLTVQEASQQLSDDAVLAQQLGPLLEVGLSYLRLGQVTQTLSAGELQRLRLAQTLIQAGWPEAERGLYLFDEPSVGLHAGEVALLVDLFWRMRQAGNTLIVVEHDLDVIWAADWVIDLGPEGGPGGGQVVVCGPPARVAQCAESHTGRCLAKARAGSRLSG